MNAGKLSSPLNDLITTVEMLFPESSVTMGRTRSTGSAFRLVPGPRRPRLIVPTDSRAAAADALNRPSANDNFRRAAPRRFLAAALSSGIGAGAMPFGLTLSPGGNSIVDYLTEAVGSPVVISLSVGAARANRKAILNVHTRDGVEVGFAKVGLNLLANQLVDHESRVLQSLTANPPVEFSAPTFLHHGSWRGHRVLLMRALRPNIKQKKPELPFEAAAAIAAGGLKNAPLRASAWFSSLLALTEPLRGADDAALPELLDDYVRRYGDLEMPFGASHGDFGAWNLAITSSVPMIWDWERYSGATPVGNDVVHYLSHSLLRELGDFDTARRVLEHRCAPVLHYMLTRFDGIASASNDPDLVKALTLGYLLTMATRFGLDARTQHGAPVRALARWHEAVIEDQLTRDVSFAYLRK